MVMSKRGYVPLLQISLQSGRTDIFHFVMKIEIYFIQFFHNFHVIVEWINKRRSSEYFSPDCGIFSAISFYFSDNVEINFQCNCYFVNFSFPGNISFQFKCRFGDFVWQ